MALHGGLVGQGLEGRQLEHVAAAEQYDEEGALHGQSVDVAMRCAGADEQRSAVSEDLSALLNALR